MGHPSKRQYKYIPPHLRGVDGSQGVRVHPTKSNPYAPPHECLASGSLVGLIPVMMGDGRTVVFRRPESSEAEVVAKMAPLCKARKSQVYSFNPHI
jgi:hypothetical protein